MLTWMTTHLREMAENKTHSEFRDPGGGRSGRCTKYLTEDLYPPCWLQIQSASRGESLVNQMSEARTESQPEFIATEKLINYPFQFAITFDMPNKFNWFLGKWVLCHWSPWANLNVEISNYTVLILTFGSIERLYKAKTELMHAALYPSLHTVTEHTEPRWSATCLFTSLYMLSPPHFYHRHQLYPISHKNGMKAAIFTAPKAIGG